MLLWGGQSISEIGSQISILAIPLAAVITLAATPFQVGLLGTLQFLPFLAVGLVAGVWVDRLPRRRILIAADCGRLVALGSIPLVAALHHLTIWQLYAVALVSGTLTVFFDVAYQSYLSSLVDRDQLVSGNARLTFSSATAEFAGPGLGGLLVGWLTAPIAVVADAVSYGMSVISLLLIRRKEAAPARGERRSLLRELGEGLRYVLGHRVLRLIAACTGTSNLFAHMAMAVVIVYAVREIGLSPAQIGLWFALGSLGGIAGAAVAGRVAARLGTGPTLIVTILSGQAAWLIIPAAPKSLALPLFIVSGVIGSLGIAYNITQVSLRQAITPQRLQGRMNATIRFLVWGPNPVGAFIGGVLGGAIGLHATLWVAAIGGLLAIVPVSLRPVRTLRVTPEPTAEERLTNELEAELEAEPAR